MVEPDLFYACESSFFVGKCSAFIIKVEEKLNKRKRSWWKKESVNIYVLEFSRKTNPGFLFDYKIFHFPHYPVAISKSKCVNVTIKEIIQFKSKWDLFRALPLNVLRPYTIEELLLSDLEEYRHIGALIGKDGVDSFIKERFSNIKTIEWAQHVT